MNELFSNVNDNNLSYFLFDYLTKSNKNLVFIAPNIKTENKILSDLKFYLRKNKDLSKVKLLNFANYETLFYDNSSPNKDIISTRINTINQLLNNKYQNITITSLETIIFKLPPKDFFNKFNLSLKVGEIIDINNFSNKLLASGYLKVSKVADKLDFAVRGSVIDIYPAGAKNPIRIDLFADEISEIRIFEIDTQRSIKKVNEFKITHATEFGFDKESRELFLTNYLQKLGKDMIYEKVENAILPSGVEYYLPLFFNKTNSFFDFLPENTKLIYYDNLTNLFDEIWQDIEISYNNSKTNLDKKSLPPQELFWQKNQFFSYLKGFDNLVLNEYKNDNNNFSATNLAPLKIQNKSLKLLKDFLLSTTNKILIVCSTKSRISILLDLLTEVKLNEVISFYDFLISKSQFNIILGNLNSGLNTKNLTIINEEVIFGNVLSQQKTRRAKHKDFISGVKNLIEINENDFIVHENYGIGRYLGLKTLDIDNIKQDLLHLEYDGGAKLLIPIDEINLISKYSGANNPPINKLGNNKWSNTKNKIIKEMFDIASELLKIYAKRELSSGYKIDIIGNDYDKFVANFAFVETDDQITAINDVTCDLASEIPMDRLICGDVGFGKTEVAMRATFLTVLSGYQVIILSPTTLLASQHYKSFVDRFDGFAVQIAELSRFKTTKQQQEIKQNLASGKVDVVIGTHKLLQKDIKYKNLGLIIIDEEHRFGVRQKEGLKAIKDKCNILSMSATPIPRTLSLALNDLRKMSIIATPPIGRTKIKTFVKEFDKTVILEAIKREIHRAGQIFFVHNDIDTIDKIADYLRELLPNINIRVAHGKMSGAELEKIMSDFYHGYFEVLVCTTIIETGIDVPAANTIIINNADNFGLSQMHQLRGRVGRSNHAAYAYLLIKSQNSISDDAKKRLQAIANLEEVGSGFNLANHDLEIRGAGDILGKNQSGKISEIGYSLYYDLLQKTIKSIQNNENINKLTTEKVEINLGVSCIIPSHYIFDVHERLEFYAKIKNNDSDEVMMELIDRYGLLPDETKNLFAKEELNKICEKLGIININAFDDRVLISFSESAIKDEMVNFAKIIELIQTKPKEYKLKNNNTLIYFYQNLEDLERINKIKQVVNNLVR